MLSNLLKLTLNEKIKEAEFFLELIKKYNPDLKQVKYYFSAFLCSAGSIMDFLLAEASQKFKLDLSLNETWYERHFKEKAKENQKATEFYNMWNFFNIAFEKDGAGKAFTEARNMNTHKILQKPHYYIEIKVEPLFEGEKPQLVSVEITGGKDASPEDFDWSIDAHKKYYLEKINKKRHLDQKPLVADATVSIFLTTVGSQKYEIVDMCEKVLTTMKTFVDLARKQYPS